MTHAAESQRIDPWALARGVAWACAILLASVVVLGLGGCARGHAPAASATPAADSAAAPAREQGQAFVETGTVTTHEHDAGDAVQVSSLIAAPAGGGERLIVGFARADGFPANALGRVAVEFLREQRVIRIHLPAECVSTSITDNAFTGEFTDRAFVVRSLDEAGLFVDLHLRSPAVARADIYSNPALVVIELKQGGDMLPTVPLVGDRVVMLTPPQQGRVTYPLTVTGYARTFEANVVGELREDQHVQARQNTTAADYASAWGEYRLRFDSGPRGKIKLFVGEHSAKDGEPIGVTTTLQID